MEKTYKTHNLYSTYLVSWNENWQSLVIKSKWVLIYSNTTSWLYDTIYSLLYKPSFVAFTHPVLNCSNRWSPTGRPGIGRGRCSCGRPGCWGAGGTGSWKGAHAATAACSSQQCALRHGALRRTGPSRSPLNLANVG